MISTRTFQAMGSSIFAALEEDSRRAVQHLENLPVWFEEWETILSRFRGDSELNRINKSAGQPVQVSPILWEVLQVARQSFKYSAGLVTPTIRNALEAAGYDRSFERLTAGEGSNDPVVVPPTLSFDAIEVDEGARSVHLPAGMRLDLGGIAKGWAAQTAMKHLSVYGPALVNAGGDIAVSSLQNGGLPWEVGITDPQKPDQTLATLAVGRGGVATSGRDYRRWQKDGTWQHHIIDPRTGRPSLSDLLAVTVIGANVLEAEAAAKVILILGSEAGGVWLDSHPTLAGYLIHEDGQSISKKNIEKYLRR